jgi:hypothetical protein
MFKPAEEKAIMKATKTKAKKLAKTAKPVTSQP